MKQGGTAGLDYSDPSLTDRFKTDLLRTGLLFRKWFKTVKHISITAVMYESENRRNSKIRVQS